MSEMLLLRRHGVANQTGFRVIGRGSSFLLCAGVLT